LESVLIVVSKKTLTATLLVFILTIFALPTITYAISGDNQAQIYIDAGNKKMEAARIESAKLGNSLDLGVVATVNAMTMDGGSGRLGTIASGAKTTLMILLAIDFIIAIMFNIDNPDNLKVVIKKLIKIGFWVYIFGSLPEIISSWIYNSFTTTAPALISGISGAADVINNPLSIIGTGWNFFAEAFNNVLASGSVLSIMAEGLGTILKFLMLLPALIVFMVTVVIFATSVIIAKVEFFIIAACAIILLPFSVIDQLKFLGEKAIAGIFGAAIKLMVTGAIGGLYLAHLKNVATKIDTTGADFGTFGLMFGQLIIAFIFLQMIREIPSFVSGFLSGSPSLSAGGVTSSAVSTGAAGQAATQAGGIAAGTGKAVSAMKEAATAAATGGASLGATAAAAAGAAVKSVSSSVAAAHTPPWAK